MIFLVQFQLLANDVYDFKLKDFISIVSTETGQNFVLSENIDNDISISLNDSIDKSIYLNILYDLCQKNKFIIEFKNSYFLISKNLDTDENKKYLYSLSLKSVNYDSIQYLFNYEDFKPQYVASKKSVIFLATPKQFSNVSSILKNLDTEIKQSRLKVTIIDTNLSNLKELGSELNLNATYSESSSFFYNLLAYPFSVTNKITTQQKTTLDSYIKILNENNVSNVVLSPVVSLFDNKKSNINNVKNIPYKTSTTTIRDNSTQSTEAIEYKDVGLKLSVIPNIYDNFVYLDLSIIFESILDKSETPTINKSEVTQTLKLNYNEVYILTGINQTQNYTNISKVPLLGDIPILDLLFKYESDEVKENNFTLILELEKI